MIQKDHQSQYFKLHVDHSEKKPNEMNKPKLKQHEERTTKGIFKDTLRQLGASLAILIIGIVIMNWSAYGQIAQSKWKEIWGTKTESPLEEIVKPDPIKFTKTVLKTSSDPEVQKRQIPALNIEVAPTDNRLIIPRIDQNIPIVRVSSESLIKRNWSALEKEMQQALKGGVVHYPGTSVPGQSGNIAITGHSSYFPWDEGRFKDVFALLHDVVEGDHLVVYWDQKKYIYEVDEIKIVMPDDIEILKQTPTDRLTLITCTPVGTNLKRLIVIAKPISDMEELETIRR